jgi:hypothetical protein
MSQAAIPLPSTSRRSSDRPDCVAASIPDSSLAHASALESSTHTGRHCSRCCYQAEIPSPAAVQLGRLPRLAWRRKHREDKAANYKVQPSVSPEGGRQTGSADLQGPAQHSIHYYEVFTIHSLALRSHAKDALFAYPRAPSRL